MPRVKRSVQRAQEAPQGPRAGQGLLGPQEHELHVREGAGRALARLRLPRPQEPQARVPAALDHPDQRRRAGARALVQPVHRGPEGGERRARPEGARRPRGQRPGGVRQARRAGQGGAGRLSRAGSGDLPPPGGLLRRPARRSTPRSAAGSPTTRASRRSRPTCAGTSRCGSSAACTTSSSAARRRGTTSTRRSTSTPTFLARFAAEQPVQTNEVARAWALLPGLLSIGAERDRPRRARRERRAAARARPLRLPLPRRVVGQRRRPLLAGDDRGGPPAPLLARRLEVVRRRGIDRDPVDVTTAEGERLLEAFVWPDQPARRERLRAAIAAVRADPPELVRGDYVELLPGAAARPPAGRARPS